MAEADSAEAISDGGVEMVNQKKEPDFQTSSKIISGSEKAPRRNFEVNVEFDPQDESR